MRITPFLSAFAVAVFLAGCGTNSRDRAEGGAATGAATGAVVGALGGPVGVGVGALVGAGAGAATGAATTPDQVDLGKPVWKNPETNVAGRHPAVSSRHASSSRHHAGHRVVRRHNIVPAATPVQTGAAAPVPTSSNTAVPATTGTSATQ